MNNLLKKNYKTIIRISYIIPILVAAGISIFHVISWYEITNPIGWAMYLSIGIEIAALSSLAGMTARMNKWVYLPFIFVTFIQLLGNIYASYLYIDVSSDSFIKWVELMNPIFERFGWVENSSILEHKRILALLSGSFIPLISLSFLHLLISFNDKDKKDEPIIGELPNDLYDKVNNGGDKPSDTNIDDKSKYNGRVVGNKDIINNSKPEPKPETKIETNPESKPEIKVEPKPETKIETNLVSKVEPKPEINPESKPEIKVEPKPETKPEKVKQNKTTKKNSKPKKTTTGRIKRDDIDEIKKTEKNRGFSVNIPKPNKKTSNNSIERIEDD
jgi:hypothetical protein